MNSLCEDSTITLFFFYVEYILYDSRFITTLTSRWLYSGSSGASRLYLFHAIVLLGSIMQIIIFWFKKIFSRELRLFQYFRSSPLPITQQQQLPILIYASICLPTNDIESLQNQVNFDTNLTTAIMDNSASAHIWNKNSDFIPGTLIKLSKGDLLGVAIIGMDVLSPHLMGDVRTLWRNNSGKYHPIN